MVLLGAPSFSSGLEFCFHKHPKILEGNAEHRHVLLGKPPGSSLDKKAVVLADEPRDWPCGEVGRQEEDQHLRHLGPGACCQLSTLLFTGTELEGVLLPSKTFPHSHHESSTSCSSVQVGEGWWEVEGLDVKARDLGVDHLLSQRVGGRADILP